MATFDESLWAAVPDTSFDATNVWGMAESTLGQAAQLRAGPEMDSAKVAVLGRGTAVRLLQRCVLAGTGALRVRVKDATGVDGWLTSKMVAAPGALASPALATKRAEFVAGATAGGTSFLRTRVGASTPDAETPVLVVLHGTSYNAGVWIPTFTRLHEVWAAKGLGFEAWIVEWAGHGRSRRVDCPDIGVDRYELTVEGPRDIANVLGHGDAARAVAEGRPVFAVAHSVGAQICCHAELAAPGTFGGIVVIEPILFPPIAPPPSGDSVSGLIKGTLVKKKAFDVPTADGVVDYLTKTAMGKQWEAEALKQFVAHGVVKDGDGPFVLRCDPTVEAAIYVNSARSAGKAFERLGDITCPCFTCIGHDSSMNGNGSSQAHRDNGEKVAGTFARPLDGDLPGLDADRTEYLGKCVVLKKCDHYVPMENSAWCAAFVDASIAKFRSPDYATIPYYRGRK